MLSAKLSSYYKNNFTSVLILVIAGLTLLAWSQRFVQDDAFISFRYAYNFAHGKGLVWNDGYRVEQREADQSGPAVDSVHDLDLAVGRMESSLLRKSFTE